MDAYEGGTWWGMRGEEDWYGVSVNIFLGGWVKLVP